jgi:hypothetical protein
LRAVFLNTLRSPHVGPSTFILDQQDENGRLLGLAQVRIRPGRPERDIVFMAPALETGNGSHAIWQRLLNYLCVQTAESGAFRIYARLPLQSEESQLFKAVGFLEYDQEEIYQLDQGVDRTKINPNLELRPQQTSDGWGLQKLYATLTPRAVQNAEGLAQGQWELPRRRWGEQGRRYGYVWEAGGELLAALHIRAGKRGYWIRTLLHPSVLEDSEELCQAALKLTAARPQLPVYFTYRQYEAGWAHTLLNLGFQPLTSQMLLVKSMTVRVRKKSSQLLPVLEAAPTESAAQTIVSRMETQQPGQPKNGHTVANHKHTPFISLL